MRILMATLIIEGYASSDGDEQYNVQLSLKGHKL
ncbi:MAG: hypothetical protein CM15mP122_3070 [Bacteroidota bacterium]|nr:MAG: hypothetical protein CM15mP122_3070 [Bacteroidota bacterium]